MNILASILSALGPFLQQFLQALLKQLIAQWSNSPTAAAILADVDSAPKLNVAMVKLFDAEAPSHAGPFRRRIFDALRTRLTKPAATNAVWDHLIHTSDVPGTATGVGFAEVLDAVL
jgi:hypothetical protein